MERRGVAAPGACAATATTLPRRPVRIALSTTKSLLLLAPAPLPSCRGCVNSVHDRGAAGTWGGAGQTGARSGAWQAAAAEAVAEMLGGTASSQVEISVKCRKLPDKDVLSKSDPMAVSMPCTSC